MSDETLDMIILYLLEEMDPQSKREFEQHLTDDPALALERRMLADVLSECARAVPQTTPPKELKEAILKEIASPWGAADVHPKVTVFPRRAPFWLAAAAVVLASSLLVWKISQDKSEVTTEVVELAPAVVPMEGQTDAYRAVRARVAWDAALHEGRIEADSLPALPEGSTYQVWILDPAQAAPLPAGVFDHSETGPVVAAYRTEAPAGAVVRIAISIEPTGGSPQPTGPVVLVSAETGS